MGEKVWTAAIMSTKMELIAMQYSEESSSPTPIRRTPATNRGTFITITITPTGRTGQTRLRIWAIPVSPPKAIWLGWKNQLKDRA